jgi:hypothetical protein
VTEKPVTPIAAPNAQQKGQEKPPAASQEGGRLQKPGRSSHKLRHKHQHQQQQALQRKATVDGMNETLQHGIRIGCEFRSIGFGLLLLCPSYVHDVHRLVKLLLWYGHSKYLMACCLVWSWLIIGCTCLGLSHTLVQTLHV